MEQRRYNSPDSRGVPFFEKEVFVTRMQEVPGPEFDLFIDVYISGCLKHPASQLKKKIFIFYLGQCIDDLLF